AAGRTSAAWRASRARASSERPGATVIPSTATGRPRLRARASTKAASSAESGRRPWSTWTTESRSRSSPASASSAQSSATESGPPDTATKTASPPASIAWRRIVSRTPAITRLPALQAHPDLPVLEVLDRAPVLLVADDAREDDDAAGGGNAHGAGDDVGRERLLDDPVEVAGLH